VLRLEPIHLLVYLDNVKLNISNVAVVIIQEDSCNMTVEVNMSMVVMAIAG